MPVYVSLLCFFLGLWGVQQAGAYPGDLTMLRNVLIFSCLVVISACSDNKTVVESGAGGEGSATDPNGITINDSSTTLDYVNADEDAAAGIQ